MIEEQGSESVQERTPEHEADDPFFSSLIQQIADLEDPQPPPAPPDAPEPSPDRPVREQPAAEAEPAEALDSDDHESAGGPASPEPETAAAPPAASAADVSLEALDETIAEEVEDLFSGDYQSIDDLEGPTPTEPSSETPALDDPALDDEQAADPLPAAPVVPTPPADPAAAPDAQPAIAAAAAASPEEPAPVPGRRRLAVAAGAVLDRIAGVLQVVNHPVRALPPSARVVVDWLALSLLLWVPIVWLIAVFVVGRG